jgi:hypothetical protein
LWQHGWRAIPVYSWDHPDVARAGKAPLGPKWHIGAQKDPPECVALGAVTWALNTGLWMGRLRGIDIDVDDTAKVAAIVALAREHLGEGFLRRTRGNSPRTLLLYRALHGEPKKRTLAGTGGEKVEVLGHGQQAVCYGRHPSGADLEWPSGGPYEVDLAAVPAVNEAQIDSFLAAAAPVIGAAVPRPPKRPAKASTEPDPVDEPPADLARIATAMRLIPNKSPANWEWWNSIGLALFAATEGSNAGRDLWVEFSALHPDYDAAETASRWRHYATSPPTRTGASKLFTLAAAAIRAPSNGPRAGNGQQPPPPPAGGATAAPGADPDGDPGEDPGAPPVEWPARFSDNALAFLFTAEHGTELYYVHEWGTWLRWDAGRWRRDPTVAVFDAARAICTREGNIALAILPKGGAVVAAGVNKATTVAAIERLTRHHAPHVRSDEQFDADHMALNLAGDAIDLRNRR